MFLLFFSIFSILKSPNWVGGLEQLNNESLETHVIFFFFEEVRSPSTAITSSDGVIGSPISLFTASSMMKKFNSQSLVATAVEREKNGLHHHSAHFEPAAAIAKAAQLAEEEDPMLVDREDLKAGASTGITFSDVNATMRYVAHYGMWS